MIGWAIYYFFFTFGTSFPKAHNTYILSELHLHARTSYFEQIELTPCFCWCFQRLLLFIRANLVAYML